MAACGHTFIPGLFPVSASNFKMLMHKALALDDFVASEATLTLNPANKSCQHTLYSVKYSYRCHLLAYRT